MIALVCLCVFFVGFTVSLPSAAKSHDGLASSADSLEVSDLVYHGIIKEDAIEGDEVELDIPLNVGITGIKGDICGYTIYNNRSHRLLPFKIIVSDDKKGNAKLVLADGFHLDYEKTHEYNFKIAAHDCSSDNLSERKKIHIEVEDVNEYAPVWQQHSYFAEAIEGQLFVRLVHLQATDHDGMNGLSKICHYRIITPDVPFEVDADGYLRNTEPLDYSQKHNYIIEVVAEDCGHLRSDSAIVNIEVKAVCKSEWTGIPDHVEFTPRENRKAVIPGAQLQLCNEACNLTRVSVTVTLTTSHIGKGCDRDTYSLQSQRKLCGAVDGTVDLLPNPNSGSFTEDLPTDDGKESDQIFAFDGSKTAIEVPLDKIEPNLGLQFTISTWMKHENKDKDGHLKTNKEQILCHSDGEDMNRHHYSVFVHNCRLILLLRLEADSGVDRNAYKPAEWRWTTPEVCDGRWHHYVINMESSQAHLYVDGKQFISSKHNPEVVDDWPLHQSKHVHFTKLVVGACWHGGEHSMVHYFHGYLAGLSILKNRTENDRVIQCLNNCQERLDFTGIDQMQTGMSVSMNSEVTNITVTGATLNSVEKLLHNIGYINTRTYPTTGHRPLTVETHLLCTDGKELLIENVKSLIMVLEAEKPIITLNAIETIETEESQLILGDQIFNQLHITAHMKTEETDSDELSGMKEFSDRFKLDSCVIRVDPPLTLSVEHLKYPENLISQFSMEVDVSEDGLVIAGADKLSHYEEVLSGVYYVNSRPQELNSRSFELSCTELNGRFISNQLKVILDVVHINHLQSASPEAIAEHKFMQQQQQPKIMNLHNDKTLNHLDQKKSDYQTVTGIIVVCIVCVGFVGLLVVLGVMRIRNAQRHSRDVNVDEREEMEWDNSALTITVNPMDQETLFEGETHSNDLHGDDSDSEDEASFHDDHEAESSEEEEEVTEKVKSRELEWDDSTLSF